MAGYFLDRPYTLLTWLNLIGIPESLSVELNEIMVGLLSGIDMPSKVYCG